MSNVADCSKIEFSAEKLRQQRARSGLTVAAVARKVGVTTRSVYLWERGERTPNATFYLRLLFLFGLNDARALAVQIGG